MTDYVSREAAVKAIKKHAQEMRETKGVGLATMQLYQLGFKHAIDVLDTLPAADVVPVVRCKDCRYYEEHHYELEGEPPYIKGKCGNKFGLNRQYMVHPEEFCSRGERRE